MAAPLVTIVMAMRNAERTLPACLRSLLQQTCAEWELLLLDDGSQDRSTQSAAAIGDVRIRLIEDGLHRGLPARLNQGIALARGRYVARMDADDIAYPQRLARQAAFLDANSAVDLVASRAILFDKDGAAIGLFPFPGSGHAAICARPWRGFVFPHPTWMGRTTWFRCHPYREQALKAQDQELLLRSYQDSEFAMIDEILLGYRQEAVSAAKSLAGRRMYCGALLRQSVGVAGRLRAARGIGYHAVALLKDALLAGRRNPLRQRPTGEQEAAWQRLWQEVGDGPCAA